MILQEVTVGTEGWTLLAVDVARCHLRPRTAAGLLVHVGQGAEPPDPAAVMDLAGEALQLDDLLPGDRVFARARDAPVRVSVLTSAPGSLRLAGYDVQDDMLKVKSVNLHSKLTQRDHLKMTHLRGSKAHRRAAPM